MNQNSFYHTINSVPGPVHCTTQSGVWLAIGSGKVVQLIKQGTIATWERAMLLPDPPKFPELEGELPEPMARSLHFLGANDDVLLVTYLDHGVIGCSAISPNEKTLVITNLYDGIDWYSLSTNHFMDTPFQHTTTHPTPENVMLPVTFIHGGSAVLSGTSYGCARITNTENWSLAERLPHEAGDIVQAVAYSSGWSRCQIVTGVAERGSESTIHYWIQERGLKKHKVSEQQMAKRQVRAYLEWTLKKPAMAMAYVALGLATLVAFWHFRTGSIDWRQWFGNAKRGSPGSFEPQPEHWWQWGPRGGIGDSSQSLLVSADPQLDQHLEFVLEQHGKDVFQMTNLEEDRGEGEREVQWEVLCIADPTNHTKCLYH
ncbi:hypothetical protein EI94DRAFT_1703551 [Lactarius quietus]|nr:hypothetical protein EI94DRAFT_1703551 [Lactarius quietus]